MNISPTELNKRLSEWVKSRIAADSSVTDGRIHFFRCCGVGLGALGLGLAVGLGFYGYSFIARNSENITVLSSTFTKALANAQLHGTAEGKVEIEPREIALAKGGTISLERNSQIALDPSAKIQAEGDIRIQPPPTISAPRPISQASASVPSISNFTVFKSVPFEKVKVVTGWNFLTSTQKAPTAEYCYYSVDAETPGVGFRIDLGTDQRQEAPESLPSNFDFAAAFDRCIWFKGGGG
jgi:hypothetical protein